MRNLLISDFARLFKSKLLYLGALAVAAEVAYTLVNNLHYKGLWGLSELTATNLLFSGTYYLPIVVAAVISFYLGTEHGDKTLRNKLIVGHGRVAIYLSAWLVSVTASLFMYVMGSAAVIAVGAPLLGGFSGRMWALLAQILCSLFSVAALTSLMTFCGMLIHGKAVSVIVAILLAVALVFFITPKLSQMLMESETVGGWSYEDESGEIHRVPEQPNPKYLRGFSRKAVQLLYELLPTGQFCEYGEIPPKHLWRYPLYACLLTGVTTAAGVVLFKRKDII